MGSESLSSAMAEGWKRSPGGREEGCKERKREEMEKRGLAKELLGNWGIYSSGLGPCGGHRRVYSCKDQLRTIDFPGSIILYSQLRRVRAVTESKNTRTGTEEKTRRRSASVTLSFAGLQQSRCPSSLRMSQRWEVLRYHLHLRVSLNYEHWAQRRFRSGICLCRYSIYIYIST